MIDNVGDDAPVGPLVGIAGSPGVAVATALVLEAGTGKVPRKTILPSEMPRELERYREAVQQATRQIEAVHERVAEVLPAEHLKVLDAYKMMLADPLLADSVRREIQGKNRNAEWAVEIAISDITRAFDRAGDAYLRERRHDVEFVGTQLQQALAERHSVLKLRVADVMGSAERSTGSKSSTSLRPVTPTIVIARDLSPADTAAMVREPVVGIVTEVGTRTSHTSIMARALEIPAVVGVANVLAHVRTGDTVVVDGLRGEVYIRPTTEIADNARARAGRHATRTQDLRKRLREPTRLACGTRVRLLANVELPTEALLAMEHGAEGIGLYRTEFIYLDRLDLPSEDEQFELYRSIVQMVAPRPVTLRTFDLGGDKIAKSVRVPPSANPGLGLRAVRLALREPAIFSAQLRAMLRASAYGDVQVMIPMVSALGELRAVRALLEQARHDVISRGFSPGALPLGVMIEVPAAAICADLLAHESSFFSLGTNDLVQYAMAMDRGAQELAHLASPFDPAILRLIRFAVGAAANAGIPTSVCGAMASDPLAALLLVGMGIRDLSLEASAIAEVKEALRRMTREECEIAAVEALTCVTANEVELCIADHFATRISDLLTSN